MSLFLYPSVFLTAHFFEVEVPTCTAKRARQLRKQVGRLRPDQAARRWLSLCSPRPGKKRIEASSHARADEIRRVIILERLSHSRQRQSDPINNKAFTSTEASKARGRVGFELTHRKDIFLFLFALREGGALSPPHLLRRERASDMHSTTHRLVCTS